MKTGVLGGTFDPVHNGHLGIAEEVKRGLNLEEILFLPAGQPWLNKVSPVSDAGHRAEMVSRAISSRAGFKLSRMEMGRTGPSYTADTIAELQGQLNPDSEIFFILGWDSLAELERWHEPVRLVRLCQLVAVPRPGYPFPDLKSMEAGIPGITPRVIIMDKPEIDISASAIRDRVARGLSISHLVPESVADYIKKYKLYLNQ